MAAITIRAEPLLPRIGSAPQTRGGTRPASQGRDEERAANELIKLALISNTRKAIAKALFGHGVLPMGSTRTDVEE